MACKLFIYDPATTTLVMWAICKKQNKTMAEIEEQLDDDGEELQE